MKRSLSMLLAALAIAGCAAEAAPPDADESESVGEAQSELKPRLGLDDSKYCLPGEKVSCTLGPPPVCTCVPKTVTTSPVFVAR